MFIVVKLCTVVYVSCLGHYFDNIHIMKLPRKPSIPLTLSRVLHSGNPFLKTELTWQFLVFTIAVKVAFHPEHSVIDNKQKHGGPEEV